MCSHIFDIDRAWDGAAWDGHMIGHVVHSIKQDFDVFDLDPLAAATSR